MKSAIALLLAASMSPGWAQILNKDSLHFKADGTKVRGSFILVNRAVPLPEGEFTLITADFRDSRMSSGNIRLVPHRMVTVVLGQMADGKLRTAVTATTVLTYHGNTGWVVEPCKADKVVLFRRGSVPFMKRSYEQNCLVVNRVARGLGPNATGVFELLRDWTKKEGGEVPIEMRLDATVTRIAQAEYLMVNYFFNPAAYGCDAANLQSEAFANGVIELGKALQVAINAGFSGRDRVEKVERLEADLPRLQQDCGRAVQAVAPAPRPKAGSAADRLKELDSLRGQGLISPAEYDERRRKILDSL